MAYGQTGSGKTHSMLGPPLPPAASGDGGAISIDASSGLITRLADDLFGQIEGDSGAWLFDVAVSVIQIYNESVDDLLAVRKAGGGAGTGPGASVAGTDLKIRQQGDGTFEVEALTRAPCKTRREMLAKIAQVREE